MPFYKHCCHSIVMEDHTDYCLSRQDEIERLRAALKIARETLEELATIEDRDGWTQNMAARVALYKLDGRL